jgi:WD40 repeat protein
MLGCTVPRTYLDHRTGTFSGLYVCPLLVGLSLLMTLFSGYSSISPDGNALCINNLSTGFDIYDLKTRKLHRTLQTPPKADRNVPLGSSFLRGGKTVITASHDGEAKIWNVARGMLVQKLPIAPGELHSVAQARYSHAIARFWYTIHHCMTVPLATGPVF